MTLRREHFEARYAADPDPWDFETSAYEHDKYERTLAALGDRRYARAFEAGCSIGVFTAMLAERCDALLAVDIAQAAVDAARERLAAARPRARRAPHAARRVAGRPVRPRRLLGAPLLLGPPHARGRPSESSPSRWPRAGA